MPFIQAFRTKRRLGIPRVGVGMLIIRCWGRVQRCGLVLNGLTPCIRWWIIATPIIWNPPGKISLWATPSGGTQEAPGILWSTWCEQSLWEHTLRQKRKMRLPLKNALQKRRAFMEVTAFFLSHLLSGCLHGWPFSGPIRIHSLSSEGWSGTVGPRTLAGTCPFRKRLLSLSGDGWDPWHMGSSLLTNARRHR